jgi:hypothetical protein
MRSFRRMEAKRGPAPQGKRRDGASEDAAIRKDRNLKEGCVVRRTIPLSLWWREIGNTRRARGEEQRGMKARPRPRNNRADGARAQRIGDIGPARPCVCCWFVKLGSLA